MSKTVCANCIYEKGLTKFISKNTEKGYCDYCGQKYESPSVVDFDHLAEHMAERIWSQWDDAANQLGWNSREMGGFIGEHYDTYDLLWELNISIEEEELRRDLIEYLGDRSWCRIEGYSMSYSESQISGWQRFSETIKHKTRYMFHAIEEDDELYPDEIPIKAVLSQVIHAIQTIKLRTWTPGKFIYRTRIDKKRRFSKADELASPPTEYANYSNRMSPAGIPMFYGAFDEETTIRETVGDSKRAGIASIGRFEVIKPMHILNLSGIAEVPSLFDPDSNNVKREITIFLREFVEDLSKPIEKDGREHIKYIPTQVFTEYIRHITRMKSDERIMGIVYPSSVHEEHSSCVLFLENEDCRGGEEAWLKLDSVEHIKLPLS